MRQHRSKRTAFLLVFLICISIGVLWQLLAPGMPYTHDGENHLARFANYYLALKEGQVPPRIAPNLLNRYGYPVFVFNYPLANMLSLGLTALHLNVESSFKLLTLVASMFGSLGVWLWLGKFYPKRVSRFDLRVLPVLAYVTAPYFISAILFRGSIGEVFVYALFPWLMWWIEWGKNNAQYRWWLGGCVLFTALLLAHNVTGLIAIGLLLWYAAIAWLPWKKHAHEFLGLLGSLLAAVGLTLWFWLPALAETSYTVTLRSGIAQEYVYHLLSLRQVLLGPLTFGFSVSGPVDGLSFALGAVSVATLFLLLVWATSSWLHSRKLSLHSRAREVLLVSLSLLLVLFSLQCSQLVWQTVSILRVLQFPWRLLLFVPILLLPPLLYLLRQKQPLLTTLLVFALIVQTHAAVTAKPVDRFHKTNTDYFAFAQSSSTQNENRAIGFTYTDVADWQPAPQILTGAGSVDTVVSWNGSSRQYQISANSPITVTEPTMWFPGWKTWGTERDSQTRRELSYVQSASIAGRLAYELPPGQFTISSKTTQDTFDRHVGNTSSLLTFFALCGGTAFYVYRKKTTSKK